MLLFTHFIHCYYEFFQLMHIILFSYSYLLCYFFHLDTTFPKIKKDIIDQFSWMVTVSLKKFFGHTIVVCTYSS